MPIGSKTGLGETLNGSFKKIPVLETSASKYYLWLRHRSRNLDNYFRQAVVEFCGNKTGTVAVPKIHQDLRYHRRPIDDSRQAIADLKWIKITNFRVYY